MIVPVNKIKIKTACMVFKAFIVYSTHSIYFYTIGAGDLYLKDRFQTSHKQTVE